MSYFCCAISLSIFHTTQNCCCYLRLSQAKWPCFTQPSPIWNHTLRTSRVGFMSSNLNLIASLRKERQTSNFYPKKTTLRLQQCGHTHLAFQCNQHLRDGFFEIFRKASKKFPWWSHVLLPGGNPWNATSDAEAPTGWLVRLQAALQHHLWKLSFWVLGGGGGEKNGGEFPKNSDASTQENDN